ncbi:unnamed protein product [Calypogeia fissa]
MKAGRDFKPKALVSIVVLAVFLLCIPSSEASRSLRHLLQGVQESQQDASITVLEGFQRFRRYIMESEVVTAERDSQVWECNVDQLEECAPPAQGTYHFPAFSSKREVPNGPNPLHN